MSTTSAARPTSAEALPSIGGRQDADKRAALLAAVDRVRPVLEANADDAERQGTLPEPAWRALHEEGLFRLKAPAELGGYEADPLTQIEVFEAVSRIDTSAGWSLFVGCGTLALASAWLPDDGIAAFMVDGRLPRVAGGLMPGGTAVPVPGGYRLSGRWQFGSGCRHAEWLTGAAFIAGTEPRRLRYFAFPASEVRIHDTWHVGGLKGTGSDDFSVEEVFVPEALTYDNNEPAARGGALYRIGLPGLVANEHGSFALGAGRRALDEMCELAKTKSRGYVQPQGVAARATFQYDLSFCEQELAAARTHLLHCYERAWAMALSTRERCPTEIQTELRCAAAYATDVSLDVCRRMFRFAGARSLFFGNPIERCLRDVQAAAQHVMVSDMAYEIRGQSLLGFKDVRALN